MGSFETKVAMAPKGTWLETSPEIFQAITLRGKNVHNGEPVEHTCYKGVLVCEYGKSEKIEAQMNQPINNRLHGSKEAVVVSGK